MIACVLAALDWKVLHGAVSTSKGDFYRGQILPSDVPAEERSRLVEAGAIGAAHRHPDINPHPAVMQATPQPPPSQEANVQIPITSPTDPRLSGMMRANGDSPATIVQPPAPVIQTPPPVNPVAPPVATSPAEPHSDGLESKTNLELDAMAKELFGITNMPRNKPEKIARLRDEYAKANAGNTNDNDAE